MIPIQKHGVNILICYNVSFSLISIHSSNGQLKKNVTNISGRFFMSDLPGIDLQIKFLRGDSSSILKPKILPLSVAVYPFDLREIKFLYKFNLKYFYMIENK